MPVGRFFVFEGKNQRLINVKRKQKKDLHKAGLFRKISD